MDNYILMNDMVQDHEARMMHLKRYYPFFRLMDTGLSQYRDGSYGRLDMSYIVLAVLRFFIEANHFHLMRWLFILIQRKFGRKVISALPSCFLRR